MREITVLIIDEHADIRSTLARRLDSCPEFRVVAHTGRWGVGAELAWFWRPDVVLIDLKGISKNAAEVFRRIGHASPSSRLIVFAAYLRKGEERACLEAGASKCLLKGITMKQLAAELRAAVPHVPAGASGERPL